MATRSSRLAARTFLGEKRLKAARAIVRSVVLAALDLMALDLMALDMS